MLTILSSASILFIDIAVANIILKGMEYLLAGLRYLTCFILKKPNTWKDDYFSSQLLFTRILLAIGFAMLSPNQIVHHQKAIKRKNKEHRLKKVYRHDKRHQRRQRVVASIQTSIKDSKAKLHKDKDKDKNKN